MIITRERIERAAPALLDQLNEVGVPRMAMLLMDLFQLSQSEAVAGAAQMLVDMDKDDITLCQNFRNAIEAADGRKFEAGS